MKSALAEARVGLRLRRRRALLTAIGIALAAAMLAAAVVVSDSLGQGFDRAASKAHLADIIVRFDPERASEVEQRIAALPDLNAFSLRQEITGVNISAGANQTDNAAVEVVDAGHSGPRGYAIVAGHDVGSRPNQVVIERGLAAAWGIPLGGTIGIQGLPPQKVVGFAEEPDNVAYPLAAPQIYLSAEAYPSAPDPRVNEAQIWLRDPRYLNEVLVQARATSYGLTGVRILTRSGVRVLLDQAAGIVIDLLVALSLIALATASVLLAASARAEVQRRMDAIGIRRALGAPRGHVTMTMTVEALLVAVPAATLGAIAGALATGGPTDRLLVMLNEPSAGLGLLLPLAGAWAVSVAIPALAAAWPAWRAAGQPPVELLKGAELTARRSRGAWWRSRAPLRRPIGQTGRSRRPWRPLRASARQPRGPSRQPRGPSHRTGVDRWTRPGNLTLLGGRLAGARRTRLAATAVTLGCSTAFVLLMLALASALSALETDPQALGKRYQLTADLPTSSVRHVQAIPGVQAAAPRYEDQAVDSFSLGETVDVIGYPGNHTVFEAPPLTAGHRMAGPDQAEVGAGLASPLGLSPGSTLALQFQSGTEVRLKVAGIISSLDHDGRVAYIPATVMLKADPYASEELAVRLKPGADAGAVTEALGTSAAPASTAVGKGVPLVDTLRAILTAVAIVDGLVCLYALTQACALTVQERRRTVAVIRACGAGSPAVRRLLAGAVAALVIPAAVLGILVETLVLGPALSNLAASYATLPLQPTTTEVIVVLVGLIVAGAVAVGWVARQATSESVVQGLAA